MIAGDDHRRYEEALAAYLLDALEPDEVRAFRVHLEGCARCQADDRWLRAAVEMLPSSVEQFDPAPGLRKRLMDRVHIEAASDAKHERRRRPRWALGLRPAAAAALATVAIVAAGLAGYLIGDDGGGATTETIQAEATPQEPMAVASVERTGDSAVLKVDRLPVQHSGRVYQTWLQRGTKIEPSSLFVVNEGGSGSAAVTGDLDGVEAIMVSDEPEGGSEQPTTKPVLVAKL